METKDRTQIDAIVAAQQRRNEEKVAEMAAGLHALADMIGANPDLAPLATYLDGVSVFYAWTKDDLARIALARLAAGAKIDKGAVGDVYKLTMRFGPVGVRALADRGDVCERVVTGVETVTTIVPDPVLVAAVPTVEVTEQVEQVEWVCRPLLASEKASVGTRVTA